jgi:hypothetical protein
VYHSVSRVFVAAYHESCDQGYIALFRENLMISHLWDRGLNAELNINAYERLVITPTLPAVDMSENQTKG